MDAGWAAIIGAAVGAIASVGATAVGAIPGLSAEDRAHRVDRRKQLLEVTTEITESLVAVGMGTIAPKEENSRLLSLYVTRVKPATLLPKKNEIVLDIFDTARRAVGSTSDDLKDRATTLFTIAATDIDRGTVNVDKMKSMHAKLERDVHAYLAAEG